MKNDLTKTLRKIIREEVEKAVRTEFVNFVSLLGESKKPKKVSKPKKKKITETSIRQMVNDIVPPKKEQISFTKDPVLNDILNETRGGVPQDGTIPQQPQGQEEWPTMGGGTFDSTRATELLGYGDSIAAQGGNNEMKRNMAVAQTLREKNVSVKDVPESLVNALSRDYSDLMKHDKMKSKK